MNAVNESRSPRLASRPRMSSRGRVYVDLEERVHHVAANPDLERIDDVVPLPRERLHLETAFRHRAKMPHARPARNLAVSTGDQRVPGSPTRNVAVR